jgi:hypothetical protein
MDQKGMKKLITHIMRFWREIRAGTQAKSQKWLERTGRDSWYRIYGA